MIGRNESVSQSELSASIQIPSSAIRASSSMANNNNVGKGQQHQSYGKDIDWILAGKSWECKY